MYMNMYTNMNMDRYVSEACPANLSSSMCKESFLYLLRLVSILVSSPAPPSSPPPLTNWTISPSVTHFPSFTPVASPDCPLQ